MKGNGLLKRRFPSAPRQVRIAAMAAKTESPQPGRFSSKLLRPASPREEGMWAVVVLPKAVSELLPRRGRTTV
jgi:hypothetical protein